MSWWVYPGVRCVCVIGAGCCWIGLDNEGPKFCPVNGQVYTVTAVDKIDGRVYVTLAECDANDCFNVEMFRPLVAKSMQDDVALFAHHLDRVGERA